MSAAIAAMGMLPMKPDDLVWLLVSPLHHWMKGFVAVWLRQRKQLSRYHALVKERLIRRDIPLYKRAHGTVGHLLIADAAFQPLSSNCADHLTEGATTRRAGIQSLSTTRSHHNHCTHAAESKMYLETLAPMPYTFRKVGSTSYKILCEPASCWMDLLPTDAKTQLTHRTNFVQQE
ncbi:hypothetical protein MBM_05540 [Drepanopeziza brunnea f. sp. 'multigermtubi' MB_m1]|uniref:Uncharacterized protein n=1 Tax=Marssonina brunnea f. sp. multigermtubi (strain MB_m1) TaxID=1072389 RepID=K1WT61_MARBU|nr:uncharacterized protein MBM_05540 [Drepanopeziza brunnea f. sp. 'multigermtubi' MB_m1]EKD16246.1 hypothetical protein MBM_05540 [Drepanopeziza brunnea f. sp. 'multigermtubi' MB_m1]